jgi:hypothetical protein
VEQADNLGLGEQVRVEGLMRRRKYLGIRDKALGVSPLAVETEVAYNPETSAPDTGLKMALRAPPSCKSLGG